jgi:hypothetical protein
VAKLLSFAAPGASFSLIGGWPVLPSVAVFDFRIEFEFGPRIYARKSKTVQRMKQIGSLRSSHAAEGLMPVAIALIIGVVVLAIFLVGILWALALLIPFYVYIGLALYLVWRGKRKEAELAESVDREIERQRLFNEQELRAWRGSLEKERRSASRRERVLRNFGRSRDPPHK